jgi:chromosome segregation ATPase
MHEDIETAKRKKVELTNTSAELTDLINTTSATIKDTKKSRKAAKDAYAREIETQQTYHERLLEDRAIAIRDTTEHLTAVMEEEERWKARIEELSQILLTVEEDRVEALRDREEYEGLLQELMESNQEFEEQQRQTELCLELLADAMDYFSQSQEHIQFNVNYTQAVFCELLKGLKQATVEAIEAEKTFEKQAMTDPRELMPYKRASDHVSGTY